MSVTKKSKVRAKAPLPEVDLATAIGNPWRFRILRATALKDMSPSGFVRDHGGEISNISRHFRQLAKWGYLEVIEKRSGGPRRGGVEHLYRTVRVVHLDTPTSVELPQDVREKLTESALGNFLDRITAAVVAGTFDLDAERHLSWADLTLDSVAFAELGEWLDEILSRLPALEEMAKRRLAVSGEEPIQATAGLTSFRSPRASDP